MTQCNTLNLKLSSSQLNKSKSWIKNCMEVNLNLSLNIIGNSTNDTNFPHRSLLANTQVSRLLKVFAYNASGNLKLSKTQLHKIRQSGGYLDRLLGPFLKTCLTLMKNGVKAKVPEKRVMRADEGRIRANEGSIRTVQDC